MTLANKITMLRIILIPVFVITLIQQIQPWPLIIFSFTMLSDALDGFIARKMKEESQMGKFLDPMGDKLLMFSAYLIAAQLGIIPFWIFVVILSRDIIIIAGWFTLFLAHGTRDINPTILGKITIILQMLVVWLILANVPYIVTEKVLFITIFFTIISGLQYIYLGSKRFNQ